MPKVMPKVIPKEMPENMQNDSQWVKCLYEHLISHPHPEMEVRTFTNKLRKEYCSEDFFAIIAYAYNQLVKDQQVELASYIYDLFAYGAGKKYFDSAKVEEAEVPEAVKQVAKKDEVVAKKDEIIEKVNFETIVNYCLHHCVNCNEIKPIYDMLLELLYGVKDERWLNAKDKIHKRMVQMETKQHITVEEGGELNLEKNVEYEVQHVDDGGTGIFVNRTK